MSERLPPSNPAAEKALLGGLLRHNPGIAWAAPLVRAEDFHVARHQSLFSAVIALWDSGKPVDVVTLADLLQARGEIDSLGGYAYLAELWDAAPTGANVEHYARIVRDTSIQRRILNTAVELQRDALAGMPAEELVTKAERDVFAVSRLGSEGQSHSLGKVLGEVADRIDQRCTHSAPEGIATGWEEVDNLLCGLGAGEVLVIAARPSVGKTAFGLAVAYAAIRNQAPTLFVSLEQTRVELVERLLILRSGVDSHRLRRGNLTTEDHVALGEARSYLYRLPLEIDDAPGRSMVQIAGNARRLRIQKNISLVVIDYLQLVAPEDRSDSRERQVSAISGRVKHLARELGIPVVVLAQLNRDSVQGQGRPPRLSDLRDSGSIEQDADKVILLHKRQELDKDGAPIYEPAPEIAVNIAKHRNGPVGTVTLVFQSPCMRFESLSGLSGCPFKK